MLLSSEFVERLIRTTIHAVLLRCFDQDISQSFKGKRKVKIYPVHRDELKQFSSQKDLSLLKIPNLQSTSGWYEQGSDQNNQVYYIEQPMNAVAIFRQSSGFYYTSDDEEDQDTSFNYALLDLAVEQIYTANLSQAQLTVLEKFLTLFLPPPWEHYPSLFGQISTLNTEKEIQSFVFGCSHYLNL